MWLLLETEKEKEKKTFRLGRAQDGDGLDPCPGPCTHGGFVHLEV
jgi:hypothetical protein